MSDFGRQQRTGETRFLCHFGSNHHDDHDIKICLQLNAAATTIMEAPEITFMFQFGSIRDAVTVCASQLNLRSLKELACNFIETHVSISVYTISMCIHIEDVCRVVCFREVAECYPLYLLAILTRHQTTVSVSFPTGCCFFGMTTVAPMYCTL